METKDLLAPNPSHRSEVHYLRLGRLIVISAVVFTLLFGGTSAAILWRIQVQAEQRAEVTALGMVDTAWQWLVDQLALVEVLDPRAIEASPGQVTAALRGLVGADKNWYALRLVSPHGETLIHLGPTEGLPAAISLSASRDGLTNLNPIAIKEDPNWVAPILFPAAPGQSRFVGFSTSVPWNS